jgi:tRNA pseudouridine13 synthase
MTGSPAQYEEGGAPCWAPGLRFLTADEPPIEMRYKQQEEDFMVEELPSIEPSGDGEHLWIEVRKRGLSTPQLVRRIARELELSPRDVGYAGRKDARAVTRQWLSLRGVDEDRARRLEAEDLQLLGCVRHERKLRLGQLAGNRFELLLRGVRREDGPRLERSLARLVERGLPNYFGAQRFGLHGRAYQLGRLLLAGEVRSFLLELTGPGQAPDVPAVRELNAAIADGRRAALRRMPALASSLPADLRGLARQLARRPGDWRSALRALDRSTLLFHMAAQQSRIFNRLLAARLEDYDRPQVGDLCALHPGRSFFEVTPDEEPGPLAERASAFEISPTGPLPGSRAPLASAGPGELERWALEEEGLGASPEEFEVQAFPAASLPGSRRSLRARIEGLGLSWCSAGLRIGFRLPPGSYATVLISELSKRPLG